MTGRKLRLSVVLCWLAGVVLPWILAWLVADVTGAWFVRLWARSHAGSDPGVYLWAAGMVTGIVTGIGASAIGLLIIFLVDEQMANRHSSGSD